tara:strand:+ start:251 stop:640 length:390 start_codon:yes stop_codon:yes gene_type:complete
MPNINKDIQVSFSEYGFFPEQTGGGCDYMRLRQNDTDSYLPYFSVSSVDHHPMFGLDDPILITFFADEEGCCGISWKFDNVNHLLSQLPVESSFWFGTFWSFLAYRKPVDILTYYQDPRPVGGIAFSIY